MKIQKSKYDTICVQENIEIKSGHPHVLPIHATSAFSYESTQDSIDVFTGKSDGFVYSRFGNPTVKSVETKIAQLECLDLSEIGSCIMTSSGMSAISTLMMSVLNSGDEVLTQYNLYGGTTEVFQKILSKYGVKIHFIDLENPDEIKESLRSNPKIKLIYFESPSNPTLNCLDIKMINTLAKEAGTLTAIDNTFATSYLQRPFNQDIDFVIYSTTKFMNGHGNSIAGAIVCKDQKYRSQIWTTMKLLGTNCNAFDAWLLHNGLKTLTVRMDKHCSNALRIAQYLESHEKVAKVNYPGLASNKYHSIAKQQMTQFGAMLSFEIKGGLEGAKAFMDNTQLCSITATLGNVDTLLLHPVTSSHMNIGKTIRDANGITDGLVRLSVGIENVEDLIQDIAHALS